MTVHVHVTDNVLRTIVRTQNNVEIRSLRTIIHGHIQAMVSVGGLAGGTGYLVQIERIEWFDGDAHHHWHYDGHFSGLELPEIVAEKVRKTVLAAQRNIDCGHAVRRACVEWTDAILDPEDTLFHCFRAIDVIKSSFSEKLVGPGMSTSASDNDEMNWARMRGTLRIARFDATEFQKQSTASRHGASPYVTESDRRIALAFTREIIARFATFVIEGKGLSELEYPVLPAPVFH